MRKLTIKRRKAFAGCLVKVKIYIEDPAGDTDINGTKCRLLGMLKNNEAATYEIGNESLKLFAIYDKMSKTFCNDIFIIPKGEEDLEISGVTKFSPVMGNPFLFDGNDNAEATENRQKNKKKATVIMVPLMIIFAIAGFFIGFYIVRL